MNSNDEIRLKNSPYEWAECEFSHDPAYWQDRAKNGNGLIQQIARFVLEQGKAAGQAESG